MGLAAKDVVLSDRAAKTLDRLERSRDPRERSIARRARALRTVLMIDCLHGEVVPGAKIPASLRQRYSVGNLYVEDLPSFWRLLYTVANEEGQRYVVILEIVGHADYDRWFPGRGR